MIGLSMESMLCKKHEFSYDILIYGKSTYKSAFRFIEQIPEMNFVM